MKNFHRQDVSKPYFSTRSFWRRSFIVLLITALAFLGIAVKLSAVQLFEHDLWSNRAAAQQLNDSLISDKRGAIVDRNGVILAESIETVTVIMEPNKVPNDAARRKIAEEGSALLDVSRDKLYEKAGKRSSRYEIVKAKIEYETAARFIDWVKENGYTEIFRLVQDHKRVYPQGSTLSCVLGFTGTDNTGLEGLEAKYNDILAGKAGKVLTTKNGWGDPLPNSLQYETVVEAKEGNTLRLTVDIRLQKIAENHLTTALAETDATGRVCAVIMDVKTGGILAMATKGDYDPNDPRTVTDPEQAAQIALLAGDERSAALTAAQQKQWKNKPISEFYEPGSVFKIFTVSTALEEKVVTESSHFFCGGTFTMEGVRTMKCHVYPRSHGDQTLAEALSHSCNPAFMKIGTMIGTERFARYHALFGFTEKTGIDMLGEARVTPSLYHTAEAITAVDVATSSIGQTFKVTPIQVITGVSAVANGGTLYRPYVVSEIIAPDGKTEESVSPVKRRRVISEDTAKRVCAMLESVVDGGGAKNAYVAGYRVAGKTGTSDKTDDKTVGKNGRTNVTASFCGFAPANDPEIAVIVLIDEPQTAIRYGGTLAAPVAQRILADALPILGIEPQYKESELASKG